MTARFAVESAGDVVAISLKQRKEGPHLMTPMMMLVTSNVPLPFIVPPPVYIKAD